jgi:hypothetical protein
MIYPCGAVGDVFRDDIVALYIFRYPYVSMPVVPLVDGLKIRDVLFIWKVDPILESIIASVSV